MSEISEKMEQLLERIAVALEARRPAPAESFDAQLKSADAFVWEAEGAQLVPVKRVAALPMVLLKGIDLARDTLFENTRRFAGGLPANNALLWGARGMGKSSLVKGVHEAVNDGREADDRVFDGDTGGGERTAEREWAVFEMEAGGGIKDQILAAKDGVAGDLAGLVSVD